MTSTLGMVLASAVALLVNLGVLVSFIAVILTVVRRQRPDAVPLLVGAMIAELLLTGASYAVSMVLPRFAIAGGGMSDYAMMQAINTLIFSLAHAAARGLLLWGIVRLARPPEPLLQ